MHEFLTAAELAERLRVRPATIRGWGRAGRIPTVRLSRRVLRFDWNEVLAALRRHEQKADREGIA
jgi:excisionase family DNA binding protein